MASWWSGRDRPSPRAAGIALTEGAAGTGLQPGADPPRRCAPARGGASRRRRYRRPPPRSGHRDRRLRPCPLPRPGHRPGHLTPSTAPARSSPAPAGPDELAIATFNVENLSPETSPGIEFAQLAEIIVDNLAAPDLVVLEEVQDNTGTVNDGVVGGRSDLPRTLIAAIPTAGGPVYRLPGYPAPVDGQDGGAAGGQHSGGVPLPHRSRAGLRRPSRGECHHRGHRCSPDRSLSVSPGRILPDPAIRPRQARFCQTPQAVGRGVHLSGAPALRGRQSTSTRGWATIPSSGGGSPRCWPRRRKRVAQAQVVRDFVDALLADDPGGRVIVLGDFNDFAVLATGRSTPGRSRPTRTWTADRARSRRRSATATSSRAMPRPSIICW